MKKTVCLVLLLFCCVFIFGQSTEEIIVQQFGQNLREWCLTKNTDYREKMLKQCIDACRVNDKIMEDFVINSGLNIKDYVVPNYLNGFEDAFEQGTVNVSMKNIRTVYADEQSYALSYNISTPKQGESRSKNFTTIACDIIISGALNYHIKDL